MFTLDTFAPVPPEFRGAFLAVGNFDGVHRGHARLIARLRARATAADAPAIALTFDPPPAALLRPDSAPRPLSWTKRKVELLKEAGAVDVGVFRTGPWLLGLTAREFFDRVVIGQFAARGMVEGPTFGFGRDRGGDAALLGMWCAGSDLDFEIVAPTELDGRLISSSRIRAALAEGLADEVADLLGRPYRLRGRVVRGAGRGTTIGFPHREPRRHRYPDPGRRGVRGKSADRPRPNLARRRCARWAKRHVWRNRQNRRGPHPRLRGRPVRANDRARHHPPSAAHEEVCRGR